MKSPDFAEKMATKLFDRFDCFAESFPTSRHIIIGEIAKTYRAAYRRGRRAGVDSLFENPSRETIRRRGGKV